MPTHAASPDWIPSSAIRHCRACGAAVARAIPAGDNRLRAICSSCHTIHYENPLNVVGTLPVWGDQVLLCKRAIEPRLGKWTLPAGFMELGETAAQGAMRETIEEAGAQIELLPLFTLIDVVRAGQVHWFYRARLLSPEFAPGEETLQAQLFGEADIPWEELAFTTVRRTLEHYFAARRAGRFALVCDAVA